MFSEPGVLHALLLVLVVSVLYALRKRLPGTQLGRSRDQLESPQGRRRRRQLIALECTELLLAGVFLLVGGAKLIGRHDMIELFVLRRPPIAAMACLSAHTYVAWGRLLHRPVNDEALTQPNVEPVPSAATAVEPVPADVPVLVNDHLPLHEGMDVAAIGESAGGVEGSGD